MAHLRKVFDKAGATDKAAKDAAFTEIVRKRSMIAANALAKAAAVAASKKQVIKKPHT